VLNSGEYNYRTNKKKQNIAYLDLTKRKKIQPKMLHGRR